MLKNLKKKHPSPSRELFFPDAFKPGDFSLIVNEQNVREAINSSPADSSPGLDGTRSQYLKDIISLSEGEAGQQALRALTKLCNFLLSGQLLQKFVIYYTRCLIKNASTHNFFICYPISMNKKTKDMVFHALRSSHK
jgi:hypothetical protein